MTEFATAGVAAVLAITEPVRPKINGAATVDVDSHVGDQGGEHAAQSDRGHGDAMSHALDAAHRFVSRFVVFPSPHEVDAVILWTAHAHAFDAAEVSPYLAVTSPSPQAGKTRLLESIELLVPRPWRVVTPSEAVVYRKIEADRPTLLLDEVDAIFTNGRSGERHEGLRALLNAGNRRGSCVPRMVTAGKGKLEFRDFAVFCPKMLAGIGTMPATVADRSIPVRLERRARTEHIERFRYRDASHAAAPVRAALAKAAEPLLRELAAARPSIPDALSDRAADSWEPLLAIADAAGGNWPERARRAALALSGAKVDDLDDAALPVLLLADLRGLFDRRGTDRLLTAEILEALAADEERPWRDFRDGHAITAHGLGRLLRPYRVRPTQIRIGTAVQRGYHRASLEPVWDRYLPLSPEQPSERYTATPDDLRSVADRARPTLDRSGVAIAAVVHGQATRTNDEPPLELPWDPERATDDDAEAWS